MKIKPNMTQEQKQLLLVDLLSRLPYGVNTKNCKNNFDVPAHMLPDVNGIKVLIDEYDLKPYLRPLSSMTDEEKNELSKKYVWNICCGQIEIRYHSEGSWDDNTECPTSEYLKLFDWFNAHHLDYRGLIPMGLAIEATEGMYNN